MVKAVVVSVVVTLASAAVADTFKCPRPVKQPARQAMVQSWPLLEKVAPMTSWSCLDGVTIGILHDASGSLAPIGWNNDVYPIKKMGTGRYLFTSNNNTPILPYFRAPASVKDTNGFTTPDGTNKWLNYDRVWNLGPGKQKGVTREAHLVRLSVNEGKGYGGGSLHFLGDQIQVLDGTKAYPLRVADVMRKALAPLETDKAWRTKLRTMIEAQLKADTTMKGMKQVGSDAVLGGYRVTWMSDTDTLRVTFYGRTVRTYSQTTKSTDPRAGMVTCDAPPGADCAPQRIPTSFTRTRTFGAEFAVEMTFDKKGKQLTRDEHYGDAPGRDDSNADEE